MPCLIEDSGLKRGWIWHINTPSVTSYQDVGPAFLVKNSETKLLKYSPRWGESFTPKATSEVFRGKFACDFYSLMKKESANSIRTAGSQKVVFGVKLNLGKHFIFVTWLGNRDISFPLETGVILPAELNMWYFKDFF